ncbi:uncharacterized protein TRIADDRAFT_51569 [Trichoplax adhaerens]|uniref:LsmAD domain-containing protein n=1 Tax=Trichoplax adhaerens TaxID=10228 RepID=B3RJZ6_TRIAD|nr:hypothetical protein TRIADDRAFT_51569 [Trichoplax adhaerens]EDV28548.1 hypothetical protein TRIADDRAFT_51569 [Trichoplax adhaerens]|eukprot:XP_002107750.1 hypothetical protein TRIADDRAFT_51569 [Trichoplax adhaerens]
MSTSVRSSGTNNRGFSNRRISGHKTYRNQQRKSHSYPSSNNNFNSSHSNDPTHGHLEGVYADAHFTYHVTSLMGVLVRVVVTNGNMFEGILRSCSPKADIVLNAVHRLKTSDNGNQLRIDDNITENMIFHPKDIVHIEARDVNLMKYKKSADFMTDSAISGYNGETEGRELTPWEADPSIQADEGLGLFDDDSARWDSKDMLHTNETKFGVKSTFDSSMKDYTTELKKTNSLEYKKKMEEAERLAYEIDIENRNRKVNTYSNLTEEGKYSAVISDSNINKYTESTKSQDNGKDNIKIDNKSEASSNNEVTSSKEVTKDEITITSDKVDNTTDVGASNMQAKDHVDVPENSSSKEISEDTVVAESVKDETAKDAISSEKQEITSIGQAPKPDIERLKDFHKNFTFGPVTSSNENSTTDSTTNDKVDSDNSAAKSENLNEKKKSSKLNPNAKAFTPTSTLKSKSSSSPPTTTVTVSTTTSGIHQTSSNTSSSYQSKHKSKGRSSNNVPSQSSSFQNHPGIPYNTPSMQGPNSSPTAAGQPMAMNLPTQVGQRIQNVPQPMPTVITYPQTVQQNEIRQATQVQPQVYQQAISPRFGLQNQQLSQQSPTPGYSYNVLVTPRPLASSNTAGMNPHINSSQFMQSRGPYYQYKQ